MNVSLYQAAAGMNANARWQEVISENMASSSIPGFKKQELSFAAIQAGLLKPTAPGAFGTIQPVSMAVPRTELNFTPGEIKRTDIPTDFAIEGSGFFEVQLPNGATAYTRDGEFSINAQGQLVTKQGYLVMGESGVIQLDFQNPRSLTVAQDGTISQGGEIRGRLTAVSFNDPKLLKTIGGGYFLPNDLNLQREENPAASIRQGFLEGANTSAVAEMGNLITVMRAFEANQKVLQTQDERMGRAISELGNPN